MTNKKVCPRCAKKLSLNKFKTLSSGRPDSYCIKCSLDYMKEYNKNRYASPEARAAELQRGRDKYREAGKPARTQRKLTLLRMFGGKCESCGYSKSAAALDFNHHDPATKTRTVSHLLAVNQPWAWLAAIEEAKKCNLLCSNCHREHTYPGYEL